MLQSTYFEATSHSERQKFAPGTLAGPRVAQKRQCQDPKRREKCGPSLPMPLTFSGKVPKGQTCQKNHVHQAHDRFPAAKIWFCGNAQRLASSYLHVSRHFHARTCRAHDHLRSIPCPVTRPQDYRMNYCATQSLFLQSFGRMTLVYIDHLKKARSFIVDTTVLSCSCVLVQGRLAGAG